MSCSPHEFSHRRGRDNQVLGRCVLDEKMSTAKSSRNEPKDRRDELFISKSKFLWGLQCHKLLWHAYNAKHLIPEAGAQQQAVFDQGHDVGEQAKELFPGGIELANGIGDFDEILAASKQARSEERRVGKEGREVGR